MIYAFAALVAATVVLGVVALARFVPARPAVIGRRLAELEQLGSTSPFSVTERRRRQARRDRWEALLQSLGERAQGTGSASPDLRLRLVHAGYRRASAPAVFTGVRLAMTLTLGALGLLLVPFFHSLTTGMMAIVALAIAGYILPSFWLDTRVKKRTRDLRRALPDALDLLVVCVEAGLGLNQAILRVADEIQHVSTNMSDELGLVNLEIRAGTPREEALRNLGERAGIDEMRALVTMLVQTDRFGTSIAQALRVHADTLRTQRRQRAEEAAAKTAIKMLFPLVLFIFPSLFIVILGPAAIQILRTLIIQQPAAVP